MAGTRNGTSAVPGRGSTPPQFVVSAVSWLVVSAPTTRSRRVGVVVLVVEAANLDQLESEGFGLVEHGV